MIGINKLYKYSKKYILGVFNKFINTPIGVAFMFHRIGVEESYRLPVHANLSIEIEKLQKIVNEIKCTHNIIPLSELPKYIKLKSYSKRPFAIFTFDDGYKDNYSLGFPFFKKNKIPFTVFLTSRFIGEKQPFNWPFILERIVASNTQIILPCNKVYRCVSIEDKCKTFYELKKWLLTWNYADFENYFYECFYKNIQFKSDIFEDNMMSWDDVREMHNSGWCEFGSHTVSHCRLASLTESEMLFEISQSKDVIEQNIGEKINSISYPFGTTTDFNNLSIELAAKVGYKVGFQSIGGVIRKYDKLLSLPRQMLY